MAVFNLSFLNPGNKKSSGGSGYGIMVDQLSILENDLQSDGVLSPGDYDLLIKKAENLSTSPGLSADQRSNIAVKISNYKKTKKVSDYTKTGDIKRMNDALLNEGAQDTMLAGNDPKRFLEGRLESLKSKINDLNENIISRQENGGDTFEYQNELQSTMADYNSKYEAYSAMANFDPANPQPIPGYVAYVKTNNYGEIVDVDYTKYGDKSGYAETNAMINGFPVFGKVNTKKDGKNYFVLGNQTFSAPDSIIPDPLNPGASKSQRLIDESTINDAKIGGGDFVKASQLAGYKNFSNADLNVQSYIPRNSFAKDTTGKIYKRNDDGSYTKYVNVNPQNMGDMPKMEDMLTLPKEYSMNLTPNIKETIDFSDPGSPISWDPNETNGMSISPEINAQNKVNGIFNPESPLVPGSPMEPSGDTQGYSNMENITPSATATSTPATTTPAIKRTPQKPAPSSQPGFMQIAKKTIDSGINAVKNMF